MTSVLGGEQRLALLDLLKSMSFTVVHFCEIFQGVVQCSAVQCSAAQCSIYVYIVGTQCTAHCKRGRKDAKLWKD